MALLVGTNVLDKVVPFDSDEQFATHEDKYGQGGLHTDVLDITERDNIPAERRKEGMLVYVKTPTPTMYQLVGGITNSDWEIFNTGGGGGGDYVQGVIDEADIDFGTGGPVDFLGAAFELQNLNGDIHVRAQIAFDDAGTTPTGVAIAFPSGTLPKPAVFGNTNLETIQGFARIYTGSSYIAGTAELIYDYPTPGRATISIRPYDGAWSGKTVQNAVVDIRYKSV